MDRLIEKTKEVIFAKQTSILSSTLIISSMLVVSRFFGFLRNRVLAGYFTKEELDIYLAAFRFPDLIFEILITGALTTTFIPFFIKYQKDKKTHGDNISTIINLITLVLFGFVAIFYILTPYLMGIVTPGFSKVKPDMIAFYSQMLLVGQLPFLVLGNFLTGISQAKKSFLLPAIAPILYNLAVIATTLLFHQYLYLMAPVVGIIIGAFLFFLIQLPILFFSDYTYRPIIKKTKAVWEFIKLVIPRIFTVIVAQIDATIDLTLTTLLGAGSYTVFYFAQHLQLLPVSVIGIAFGQASLPYLSEVFHNQNMKEFKKIVSDSILNLFFLTMPLACFFIFARTPLVRFFYGGEKFDWDATVTTAYTLSYFALSIPFHSIYYFLTRCFYAIFDSKTPFYLGLFSIAFNFTLSILFTLVFKMPVWALAISFSTSMIVNVLLLGGILHFRLKGLDLKFMAIEGLKISVAAISSSIMVYYLQKLLDGLIFDTTRTINVFLLLVTGATVYFVLYLGISWVLNVKEMYLLTH
ncbi:murein biosynthesis integral membrane protein MurJ, partial [Candidatus Roizmanbacteria bacterium]|nr:murein biosynthesis integral membrane protein MurJ [Candidatus Roizmanbacteria bacterium]